MSAAALWCQAGASGRRPRPLAGRIAEGLRDAGLAVDVVHGGPAAPAHAGLTAYDVIVLDQDLPVMHGDQMCARSPGQRPHCEREPATRGEALQQREGLAIVWLHLDGGHLTLARHCVHASRTGPVIDVSCSRCGKGPLITGQPPELGGQLAQPAFGAHGECHRAGLRPAAGRNWGMADSTG